MKHWYAVHSQPRGEETALLNLKNQGFEAFLPRFHKARRHARKTEVVISPLFPRYLFVSFDPNVDPWLSIDSTKGVAYILRQNGCPIPVPANVIESLQQTASPQEIVPLSSLALFKQGDLLEVQEGAFAGNVGTYEKMTEGERVELLLNMLGRQLKLSFPLHSVQAIG